MNEHGDKIYLHVGSDEVLLNFLELLIHTNALSRMEINI